MSKEYFSCVNCEGNHERVSIDCDKFLQHIRTSLVCGSVMALAKLVIQCPYCHWSFETKPPDPLHSDYSFEKPHPRSFRGKVVEKILVCENPRCKRRFKIYWYTIANYFPRMQ